jgi:uncharacterized coiled-coil DUF342 family protein
MPRKKTKSELEVAELRYRSLMDKRNEFNRQAQEIIKDIDGIRVKKNLILDDLAELREQKAQIHDKIQAHKRRRDEYQKRAKDLLALKKSKKGKISANLEYQLNDLDKKIVDMEFKQETTFMTVQKENELLDELREEVKKRGELEVFVDEQKELLKEVKNIDLTIDELFKIANEEHEEIVKLFPEAKKFSDKMSKEFKKVGAHLAEMKKKREVLDGIRQKADHYHQRVKEMREKILTIKKSTREDVRKARQEIRDQNIAVKKALEDEQKLSKKAEETLESLMKKGRIEL